MTASLGNLESLAIYGSFGRLRQACVRHRVALGWIVVCLLVNALLHCYGGEDDKYITFWAARSLAEHGQILNYNGEHLEQSSSLGFVVLLALLYKVLPLSMPAVGYLASMSLFAVTLMLAVSILKRSGVEPHAWVVPAIGSVMNYGYWATSGMENTFVTATELWMVLALTRIIEHWNRRRLWWALLATLAFVSSRPESPIIAIGVVLGVATSAILVCRNSKQFFVDLGGCWRVAGVVVVAVGLLVGFRLVYFHAWVPNPAQLKSGGFDAKNGADQLWSAFLTNGPHLLATYVVALIAIAASLVRGVVVKRPVVMLACVAFGHLAFVVQSGGDWMGGFRFLSFAIPSLLLTSFLVNYRWLARAGSVAALALANLICGIQMMRTGTEPRVQLWNALVLKDTITKRIKRGNFSPVEYGNRVHMRDTVTIARLMPVLERIVAASPGRPIWIMTGQAGIMPYKVMSHYFGRVKLQDLWSLTSRDLYDCFPKGSIVSGAAGSGIAVESALRQLQDHGSQCGIPMPDVYYNEGLTSDMRNVLERYGYLLIYEQGGTIHASRESTFFPSSVEACGHFAVRRELAARLGISPLETEDWNHAPRR